MNRSRVSTCLVLIASLALGAGIASAQTTRRADHVVLISIDGLRPEFYRDLQWPAPTLQQMAREGAHAWAVRGVFPSVTYPTHTTILTGALPARHGIFYNTPFEPGGQTGRWYWEASSIRVPTLWDAVRDAGLESANVWWPVSVGAPVTRNVPELWPLDSLADPIDTLRAATTPAGLLEEIEREATGRLTKNNFTIDHMTRDDRAGAMAAYLLERYRPAFLTVHLIETDHFQHEAGRDADIVRRAVATADRAVGQILEAAERAGILERTAFIITGDHGFFDIHTVIAPNVWLVEAGLLEDRRDRGEWRAAFHTAGGSAFLQPRRPNDVRTRNQVREVIDSLPRSLRQLFRVVERPELDRVGADPGVPFALAALPGVAFTASTETPALRPGRGGTHGFFPEIPEMHTGFVAWGAGIRPGSVAPILGLEQIAPLIAELLSLSFETSDGTLLPGLLLEPVGAE